MTINSDYRLHKRTDPLPDHIRRAPINAEFHSNTQTISIVEVKRIVKRPAIVGLVATCDKCGNWQEIRPCLPEDVDTEVHILGWRECDDGSKNICPACVRKK